MYAELPIVLDGCKECGADVLGSAASMGHGFPLCLHGNCAQCPCEHRDDRQHCFHHSSYFSVDGDRQYDGGIEPEEPYCCSGHLSTEEAVLQAYATQIVSNPHTVRVFGDASNDKRLLVLRNEECMRRIEVLRGHSVCSRHISYPSMLCRTRSSSSLYVPACISVEAPLKGIISIFVHVTVIRETFWLAWLRADVIGTRSMVRCCLLAGVVIRAD